MLLPAVFYARDLRMFSRNGTRMKHEQRPVTWLRQQRRTHTKSHESDVLVHGVDPHLIPEILLKRQSFSVQPASWKSKGVLLVP